MKKEHFLKTFKFWLSLVYSLIVFSGWWFLKDFCEGTKGCLSDWFLVTITLPSSLFLSFMPENLVISLMTVVDHSLVYFLIGLLQWFTIGWLIDKYLFKK